MQRIPVIQRARQEVRGLVLSFLLVAATTLLIFGIIEQVGLTRGTVVYLVPVLIAAVRWGLTAALFAAALGVLASMRALSCL